MVATLKSKVVSLPINRDCHRTPKLAPLAVHYISLKQLKGLFAHRVVGLKGFLRGAIFRFVMPESCEVLKAAITARPLPGLNSIKVSLPFVSTDTV
jgi:hypothetical protein